MNRWVREWAQQTVVHLGQTVQSWRPDLRSTYLGIALSKPKGQSRPPENVTTSLLGALSRVPHAALSSSQTIWRPNHSIWNTKSSISNNKDFNFGCKMFHLARLAQWWLYLASSPCNNNTRPALQGPLKYLVIILSTIIFLHAVIAHMQGKCIEENDCMVGIMVF
jgi:hypothetical protein